MLRDGVSISSIMYLTCTFTCILPVPLPISYRYLYLYLICTLLVSCYVDTPYRPSCILPVPLPVSYLYHRDNMVASVQVALRHGHREVMPCIMHLPWLFNAVSTASCPLLLAGVLMSYADVKQVLRQYYISFSLHSG